MLGKGLIIGTGEKKYLEKAEGDFTWDQPSLCPRIGYSEPNLSKKTGESDQCSLGLTTPTQKMRPRAARDRPEAADKQNRAPILRTRRGKR